MRVSAHRIGSGPIIQRFMDQRMGANVNGPSLIKSPDWLSGRLGAYHLYFAHHLGSYIRMAYADHLAGPWTIYSPGVLDISETSQFYEHLASPDVHVDEKRRELRMYFHGVSSPEPWEAPEQATAIATSKDGIRFSSSETLIGKSYFRVWCQGGAHYAVSLGGQLWRSVDGGESFEEGPVLDGLPAGTRHPAVLRRGDQTWIAWSAIGDCPERILIAEVDTSADWRDWKLCAPQELLRPTEDWEGAELPLEPSRGDLAPAPVRELRDPAFYSENGKDYLLYSVAGEAGIALAELRFHDT